MYTLPLPLDQKIDQDSYTPAPNSRQFSTQTLNMVSKC